MTSLSSARPATRLYIAEKLAARAALPLPHELAHRLRTLRRCHGTLRAVEQHSAPEPGPDVWLVFAPIKRARIDWLVEKATELGAAALVPVVTARTQSERINRERLRIIAIAAAEQSERLSLPEIRPEVPLVRLLAEWPADRHLVLCDESGAGQPAAAALAAFESAAPAAM